MTENAHRNLIKPLQVALYNYEPDEVKRALANAFAEDAKIHLAYPFEDLRGPDGLFDNAFTPLAGAFPDLERRDYIVMGGTTAQGDQWIGCCGHYTGAFMNPFLDIPPTGHQASMRFHEFYRVEENRVVEFQALWDIPELMMQANAWPMAPSLGREWLVPGPATQDGLTIDGCADEAQASYDLVLDMANHLGRYAEGGVAAMQLPKFWHPRCSWYGPAGIGTGRGIDGFRNWHQIPFLNGMPNRKGNAAAGHLFAEGNYVGFTAWPGMTATISDDGWMGIAPANQQITMRSLDFWRVENGLIRENWVLVDLLDVYHQVGVDVFARMREFNKARRPL